MTHRLKIVTICLLQVALHATLWRFHVSPVIYPLTAMVLAVLLAKWVLEGRG